MRRLLLCLAGLFMLAACTAEPVWAPDDAVARARYVSPEPPSITLFTVLNNTSNAGEHSALMINASQQAIFDPAGTWRHPMLPERNDVHFGMSPRMVDFYIDYHARENFRVVQQTVFVTPEVAELALQRVLAHGAVPKAQCAQATSSILRGLPGFSSIPSTFGPKKVMRAFGALPGVTERVILDTDANQNHGVLLIQAQQAPQ
jgi:hypothetical protein